MNSASIDSNNPAVYSYTRAAVLMHWLIAAALFAQLVLGWWMLDLPKSPPGLRAGWFNLHKSIGLTIAMLVLLRLAWRDAHPRRADPEQPAWQRHAAGVNHALLYMCMLLMPITGLLGSNFTRYPVLYFGLKLPGWNHDWPAAKQLMSSVHYAVACLLMLLIGIHVVAALWHWLRRDAVCERMGLPPPPTLSRS